MYNIYLYINIKNHQRSSVFIINDEGKNINSEYFSCEYQFQIGDKLLYIIDKILSKSGLFINRLSGVIVTNKSKEMTSLRIGVSVANALAYSLNIPVVGVRDKNGLFSVIKTFRKIKKNRLVMPVYEINPMLKSGR